jgi:hypothetical protein
MQLDNNNILRVILDIVIGYILSGFTLLYTCIKSDRHLKGHTSKSCYSMNYLFKAMIKHTIGIQHYILLVICNIAMQS